jgi:hypothetical protein
MVVLAMLVTPLPTVAAQRMTAAAPRATEPPPWNRYGSGDGAITSRLPQRSDSASSHGTAWAVLASAVLPGTGQALLDQDRFVAYLAVEAYAWARYAADAREGRLARARYRNLASDVARRPFSTTRPVGDFDYYERMEKFVASGAFDAIPGGPLDPETDTTTANGAIWLLARQTYWSSPNAPATAQEYTNAELFYRDRAVGAAYQWSWSNARLEYAEFRRTIRRSNNAYRTSLQDLGLVIANHALSTVDAFITVRLRRHVEAGSQRFELSGSIPIR